MTPSRLRPWLPVAALVVAGLIALAWIQSRKQAAPSPAPAASAATPAPLSASQVERGIETAKASVERDPKDAAGWAMLAHSQEMLGRFDEAAKAYAQLVSLHPDDAQAHADYADALGVVNKGRLQGEPAQLIAKALALDANNLKALVLGGKEAFERQRYDESIALWERALKAGPDPTMRRPIETSIAEARALAAPGSSPAPTAGGPAFVSGRVTVAASLQAQIGPDDSVFIYARAPEGSRMPVALLRKKASELPLDFALDDTLAMVPQSKLSNQAQVMLGVRVSKRGDAIPVAGDLEGELGPVKLGSTGLKLEINRVHP